MVEGPGCKLKGEKIKGKLLSKTVTGVKGNAVQRDIKPTKGITKSKFHVLVGRKLDGVQTLGKELFMYFGDLCLRVHFLMSGSFRVNNKHLDNDYGSKSEPPSLEVVMSTDVLAFFDSAVDIRTSESCKQRYEDLNELDICSPKFNHKRAVALVTEQKGRQLCDVLLDQVVLPGVGNIIKNEALFDSGIRPNSKVEELTEEHISHLVKMTRDFSMIFYKCRKEGTNLGKFIKIYNKTSCKQCNGKVTICRLGDDTGRKTYFCANCQDNDLKSKIKRTLPTKNSLLGWVQSGGTDTSLPKEDWTCSQCTYINKNSYTNCEMCTSSRSSNTKKTSGTSVEGVLQPTNSMQGGPSLPNMKRKMESTISQQSSTISSKRQKMDSTKSNSQHSKTQNSHETSNDSRILTCPGHNKKCALNETHKKGDNYGRWFFTCAMRPKTKQCKFFKWADGIFPICEGHGKTCTLRTVLKLGPNNGRKFFACHQPKNKQCGYFE